jgi:hypothetical protein
VSASHPYLQDGSTILGAGRCVLANDHNSSPEFPQALLSFRAALSTLDTHTRASESASFARWTHAAGPASSIDRDFVLNVGSGFVILTIFLKFILTVFFKSIII